MPKQSDQFYQAFLLRCWLKEPATTDELPTWRFELREVAAQPWVLGFHDKAELTAFISAEMLRAVEERNE